MRPILTTCAALSLLVGCNTAGMDIDMRDLGRGFDTSAAVQATVAPRPQPDGRGVISYPNYQVVVAGRGETPASIAARLGLDATQLARYNGVPVDAQLNAGEILALPGRVAMTGPGGFQSAGGVDIQTLAGNAINRAAPGGATVTAAGVQTGEEPVRHKVEAGETAYSIARLYGVSAKSIGEWNGLGPDLTVRTGQYLLIPVVLQPAPTQESATSTTEPGAGSPTPLPPSSVTPLPDEETVPVATASADDAPGRPESPDLGQQATAASASNARMSYPVSGSVVRDFQKGKNDGIDISASAGAPVKAAASGTVAAITEDTDQVPILVLRHADGLLTVYANVDNLKVKKGQSVQRGESIANVRSSDAPYLHFEVRDGVEAVDPAEYLN
ncbi:peptidoglycan DD-metalloendopeptidase family protein [Tropicimonas sp. IMCC6043]|uniref:peptidoglycan DD-metalloendopeptidase family protein n=1 Tax=Tropicimonas sp. IMCC6043 TaxID=2510645 RepID=UPI00101B92AC|nr:peptidoglycan DD-metalloendopeptidase family protein [Tropicimonas sp. IMCC6043]RYH11237.1 LysM peptidoglycan-binding domain-containing protein [Tropicimonas sp. IMCC6043]